MPTEKQAITKGQKLLKKMKGKGWKLRVHENIGSMGLGDNMDFEEKNEDGWKCAFCKSYASGTLPDRCPKCNMKTHLQKVRGYWKLSPSENYLSYLLYSEYES